jgi:hypothetical protein
MTMKDISTTAWRRKRRRLASMIPGLVDAVTGSTRRKTYEIAR